MLLLCLIETYKQKAVWASNKKTARFLTLIPLLMVIPLQRWWWWSFIEVGMNWSWLMWLIFFLSLHLYHTNMEGSPTALAILFMFCLSVVFGLHRAPTQFWSISDYMKFIPVSACIKPVFSKSSLLSTSCHTCATKATKLLCFTCNIRPNGNRRSPGSLMGVQRRIEWVKHWIHR